MSKNTIRTVAQNLKLNPQNLVDFLNEKGCKSKDIDTELTSQQKTVIRKNQKNLLLYKGAVKKDNIQQKKESSVKQGLYEKSLKQSKLDVIKNSEKQKKLSDQQQVIISEQKKKQKKSTTEAKEEKISKKKFSKKTDVEEVEIKIDDDNKNQLQAQQRKLKKKERTILAQKNLEKQKQSFIKPVKPIVRTIEIDDINQISNIAKQMSIKATEVAKIAMKNGLMVSINDPIDRDTAILLVEEMGHTTKIKKKSHLKDLLSSKSNKQTNLVHRSPIVTIMGHVDHGKTTLIDTIRKTKLVNSEKGGITQYINAYQVSVNGSIITFIDTPGHSAFSKMRSRGVHATDIVILVVAQEDGVMPQTIESIKYAKASKVPIIVAINKMDKPGAQIEKIKKELSQQDLISEDWGGDVLMRPISALKNNGIDKLLEAILLQSEMLELQADEKAKARGFVIESKITIGRGKIVSLLVKDGCLKIQDYLIAGTEYGKIKSMIDSTGKSIKIAKPSTPVEVIGFNDLPKSGDEFFVVEDEKIAKKLILDHKQKQTSEHIIKMQKIKSKKLMATLQAESQQEIKNLNLLIKTDVNGLAQTISDEINQISEKNEDLNINIVNVGVGAINETDVSLAIASEATIIGFNVRADSIARKLIDNNSIETKYYSIVYRLLEDIESSVQGLLVKDLDDKIIGNALVKEIFKSKKLGDIAGCVVTNGVIKKSNPIRVLRKDIVIYEGELESLRRFQDEVKQVKSGLECGIGIKNYNVEIDDIIEVFEKK